MSNSSAVLTIPDNVPFDLGLIEEEHALWLASAGKDGKRANFRGVDLSSVDLSGRRFTEASFRGAVMMGTVLRGADLRAADFSEAILDHADLQEAQLCTASFARARLVNANISGADLTAANCSNTIADGLVFKGTKLDRAVLRDANFRNADGTGAFLRHANLRGALLVGANLKEADLSDADCRDANCDQASFTEAVLRRTDFLGATLRGVDLKTVDFSDALDIAAEFQVESLQSGHTQMMEVKERIAAERNELRMKEEALRKEQKRIDEACSALQQKQDRLQGRMQYVLRAAVASFALWFLVTAALLVMTGVAAMQVETLKQERVVAIVSGIVLTLFFAAVPMVCCLLARYFIRRSIALSADVRSEMAAQPFIASNLPKPVSAALATELALERTPSEVIEASFGRKK
jgi:uncharacterized protein YjbI with pentapeptide repeats